MSRTVLVSLLGLLAALPRPVSSSSLLDLTGSPSSLHGFTSSVFPTDLTAVSFNPAMLVDLSTIAQTGLVLLVQDLDLTLLPRPDGVDISESIYSSRVRNPDGTSGRLLHRPLATNRIRNPRGSHDPSATHLYLLGGALLSLFDNQIALGLLALMPLDNFQSNSAFYSDEREQYFSNSVHFELLEDRLTTTHLSLGLGARPLEWLKLGAGLTMVTSSSANTAIYITDPLDQELLYINGQVAINTSFAPHFALALSPWRYSSITATLHWPRENVVEGSGDLQFWDFEYPDQQDSIEQPFAFTFGYMPLRTTLGMAWQQPRTSAGLGYGIAALARWNRWSEYLDRHSERPSLPWSDTFDLALGAELAFSEHSLGLDLTFVPTPVPAQTGRSNYADNDRLGLALGWEWRLPVAGQPLRLALQGQLHRLLPRSTFKDSTSLDPVFDEYPDSVNVRTDVLIEDSVGFQTNNPGYPGWDGSGWLMTVGLSLRYEFEHTDDSISENTSREENGLP